MLIQLFMLQDDYRLPRGKSFGNDRQHADRGRHRRVDKSVFVTSWTKKNWWTQFCVHYRRLNELTIKDSYRLLRIDDTNSLIELVFHKWKFFLPTEIKKHFLEVVLKTHVENVFSLLRCRYGDGKSVLGPSSTKPTNRIFSKWNRREVNKRELNTNLETRKQNNWVYIHDLFRR